jgi:hypothetical protein
MPQTAQTPLTDDELGELATRTVYNFGIVGGEVFRIGVVFAPPRPIWG